MPSEELTRKNSRWYNPIFGILGTGTFASILSLIFGLGYDLAFAIIYFVLFVSAIYVLIGAPKLTRTSDLLVGSDGKPLEISVVTSKAQRIAFWIIQLQIIGVVVSWFFWATMFPLVKMDDFAGSPYTGGHNGQFLHKVPQPVRGVDGKEYLAYPSIKFTISKSSSVNLKLKRMSVISSHFSVKQASTVSGVFPENVVGVNCFRVFLPADAGTSEAEMILDDNSTLGTLVLN